MTGRLLVAWHALPAVPAIAMATSGCRKASPSSPETTDPTEFQFTYERQLGAGSLHPPLKCEPSKITGAGGVLFVTRSWLGGTATLTMTGDPAGSTFTVRVIPAASSGRFTVLVADPWLCRPNVESACDTEMETGKGISVNGLRLNDGGTLTSFTWAPPDKIAK